MSRNAMPRPTSVAVLAFVLSALASACKSTVPAKTRLDDAEINSKIEAKWAAGGEIHPFNIDVDTNEGDVTLRGRVTRESSKIRAEQPAHGTLGVRRGINLIKVGEHTS
ncbi:MAG TPA: BON domain-containing protein [Thermoanaerobaculia bacterium]|nr:BON domain-containing protein [Thermoanaerobaculia bacterium]